MTPTGWRRGALRASGIGLTLMLAAAACGLAGSGPPSRVPGSISPPTSGPIATPLGSAPDALPTLLPAAVLNRAPTRVRIRELGIDLPVVAPPVEPNHFPYCDVAEYLPALSRPGRPGATFLYAHARAGMFLPLLEESRVDGGRSLLGLEVDVFTSDGRRFTYEITDVIRHVTSLETVYRATAEQLILQTSEGPRETIEKTLVVAAPRQERSATQEEARPPSNPVRCE